MPSKTQLRLLGAALLAVACSHDANTSKSPAGDPTVNTPTPAGTDTAKQPETVGRFDVAAVSPMSYPVRIAAAADDTIFVSDAVSNEVLGFRNGQVVVGLVGLDKPLGLAVSGDLLYVGNSGRADVEVYSLSAKKFVRTLGEPGDFAMPNAISVAPDGVAYVVDSKKDTVRVFAADGTEQDAIGTTGAADGQFHFPSGVAADADKVVVADQGNHRVQIFDREGGFVRTFGSELAAARTVSDLKGKFNSIGGVTIVGDEIYVVESMHAFVQTFDENGESKGIFGKAGVCGTCSRMPLDVTVDSKGRVLATDPEQRRWVALSTERR